MTTIDPNYKAPKARAAEHSTQELRRFCISAVLDNAKGRTPAQIVTDAAILEAYITHGAASLSDKLGGRLAAAADAAIASVGGTIGG